ncbi:leucyl aminopeptidase family protein [Qipengyuania sphaerica]|uniref:leucyl aminopeptidase family protein n=1 Tax=Qipengyuania sphaerica TaxID=2867243 RepID=UPI001C883D0D|nr:M17 family peptidase N-terminal domain-containing protein [Qipengyuania sphaerica]MBX7539952.1 leucyl aminopeptidase [Qipengyuania sphaerica]
MKRTSLAAISLAVAPVALIPSVIHAQDVSGSGIVPATIANSAERPMKFATQVPGGAALAVVMTDANLPAIEGLPADAAARVAAAEFTGSDDTMLELPAAPGAPRIVLFGVAKEDGGSPDWRVVGGRIAQELANEDAAVAVVGLPGSDALALAALGATLGQYRFDRYKTDREDAPSQAITFVGAEEKAARMAWETRQSALATGVRFARDLVNEPASVIYPESFVARARELFRDVPDVSIRVLDQADMRRLNMGAIAGVGQGSKRPPRLMMITYRGASGAPIALAGKGITFDTGGISIKPSSGMGAMKRDMSGAAAVTGAIYSLAKSRAPVHVVAVAALAENMPGDNAQRPGDVVRTMSGKTIEIVSTDAEGRLVLSDAIEYVVSEAKPYALVDIATLTGSVGRALGPEYAGVFAREDAYAEAAIAAGERSTEELWQLPMHETYRKAVRDSEMADVVNSGVSPGASSGAHFIEYFVPEDLPWLHIDMAGVDDPKVTTPLVPKGSSGFGVMLLDELARSWRPE